MYSRRHKNAKLYFTFTLSHQRLCCQKGKREKGAFFSSTLLFSPSLLSAFLSLLAVCVFFWSNVKCDARGNAQILSFINWNVRKSWVRPAHDWQAGNQIRCEQPLQPGHGAEAALQKPQPDAGFSYSFSKSWCFLWAEAEAEETLKNKSEIAVMNNGRLLSLPCECDAHKYATLLCNCHCALSQFPLFHSTTLPPSIQSQMVMPNSNTNKNSNAKVLCFNYVTSADAQFVLNSITISIYFSYTWHFIRHSNNITLLLVVVVVVVAHAVNDVVVPAAIVVLLNL